MLGGQSGSMFSEVILFFQVMYVRPYSLFHMMGIDICRWGRIGFVLFSFNLALVTAETCNCCVCSRENWIVPDGYDKNLAPFESEDKPTDVFINIDIMDIDEITEERMEYSMQFYVNEYWKDPRLNISNNLKKHFQIPKETVKLLWTPDIIFENSKGGWVYQLAVPNIIVKTHLYGYLHRFTRYNMKIACTMYLQNFPMDTQKCFLSMASLANDDSKMMLKWIHERSEEEVLEKVHDLYLANVHPLKYHVANATTSKYQFEWPIGLFTSLQANFTFARHLSSHIFNAYIPSGLVVMLSFLSFWLNVRSVPARVALGLTSLLTLSTQASQVRSHLPPINYLTAIDVWLFTCILQVFLSLIEYATVYSLYSIKVRKRRATSSKAWSDNGSRRIIGSELSVGRPETRQGKRKTEKTPTKEPMGADFEEEIQVLDRASKIVFPLGFFVFSLVYWISYLSAS
ncbi:gamma-aminobutyric acid receptor subunit rho-2 [Nephila pilipes]|uniref:Gamma-aminobutyric acid receptor subunit rho-2 n=1 Tax=Nephila pilipes TaxID=299642 RepID=A0A8X6QTD8_NEPPI|nr:gamma-aminobutyric acid receptor subunit rho-2 [Nephila pilipes]